MSDRAKRYLQLLQEAQATDSIDEFWQIESEMKHWLTSKEIEEIYINLI